MSAGSSSTATRLFLIGLAIVVILLMGYLAFRKFAAPVNRTAQVLDFLRRPDAHPDWMVRAGERCGDAPFIQPTDGFVGYLWDDSFRVGHRHQGIDVFGGRDVNMTLVIAAYPGYLTRMEDWKSSIIMRVPEDPLRKGRQIWLYYTHMAGPAGDSYISSQFPAGVEEVYVEAGTLLGYQGNYSGDPGNPVGVHLHFSIVLDDGGGRFLNELKIENTLDPSPYLGLPLNAASNSGEIPLCQETQ